MAWTTDRKQFVAFVFFFFDPLHGLLKKWSDVMPQGWEAWPYLINLINFLSISTAFLFIYRYTAPRRQFSLWMTPVIVTALAFITYLRW